MACLNSHLAKEGRLSIVGAHAVQTFPDSFIGQLRRTTTACTVAVRHPRTPKLIKLSFKGRILSTHGGKLR